jgi:large subunit ribosomal protein L4
LVREGRITVVDAIELDEVKTKKIASVLETLQVSKKTLVVDDKANERLRLSLRNMQQNQFLPPEGINVYDLLRHDHVVVSKGAAKAIEARCTNGAAKEGGGS